MGELFIMHALLAGHILECEKRGEFFVSRMPPKCQGTKRRWIKTESEAGPESVTNNQINSATLARAMERAAPKQTVAKV